MRFCFLCIKRKEGQLEAKSVIKTKTGKKKNLEVRPWGGGRRETFLATGPAYLTSERGES